MTLPNFLVIGAPKCGTTSLYHYLQAHPQVYMSPVKEPGFFSLYGKRTKRIRRMHRTTDLASYTALFDGLGEEIAVGEATTAYLRHPEAPGRIKDILPEARLIAILRDPSDRAQSAFNMDVYTHHAQTSLAAVVHSYLNKGPGRPDADYTSIERSYIFSGFYAEQLQRYYQHFPREQVRVYLFEDLVTDPASLLADLYEFLGVDPAFQPNLTTRHNQTRYPRRTGLHRRFGLTSRTKEQLKRLLPVDTLKPLVEPIRRINLTKPPRLSPALRRDLVEIFQSDITALQELLDRDLSGWLEIPGTETHL